jgi:hypothetical protein
VRHVAWRRVIFRSPLVGATLVVAVAGAVLLAVDIVGLWTKYTVPAPAIRPAELGPPAARQEPLSQRAGELDASYFRRLARDVHARMATYWSNDERVAFTDNWVLNLLGHVSSTYRAYEFVNPDRALQRGIGVCSQYVNVVFGELKRSGYAPTGVLMRTHSVVEVSDHQGRPYVLDALYGIVLPHSYAALHRRPGLADPHYRAVTRRQSTDGAYGARLARRMRGVFRGRPAAINRGTATPHTAYLEPLAYVLKWLIPAGLVAGSLAALLLARRTRQSRGARI